MVPCTVWLLKLPQFGPTLQLGHQRVPHTGWLLKCSHFGPTLSMVPIQADCWKVFGPNFSVGQQMAPIQSWLFADCLTVLFQWPWNGKEDGNLGKPSYKVGWHPYLLSQLELTWHGDSFNFWSPNPTQVWCPHEKNCHAKLAPTGSINMGASPLRNLASLSYHPL